MRTRDFSRAPAQARAGAMFIGGTRYANPLVLLRLAPDWIRMVRDMRRMSGYCWHTVYWRFPLTLGTIAFFTDRDALLRRPYATPPQADDVADRRRAQRHRRVHPALHRLPGRLLQRRVAGRGRREGHIERFTPLGAETTGPAVRR
ncbi:DUF4188 domain-containing protein [Micromonospora sp. BRA006-A]|nr:DUF4188 domain-containing protein [Micromonospora sp. BRA006-A]